MLTLMMMMASRSVIATAGLLRAPPLRTAVVVQVHGEAHSRACRDFIVNQLQPVYNLLGGLTDHVILNIEFVPFGQAQIIHSSSNNNNNNDNRDHSSSYIACTHGPLECDVHSYMQCAQALYPTTARHWPFVVCLYEQQQQRETMEDGVLVEMEEHNDTSSRRRMFAECAHSAQLDWPSLQNCHDNDDMTWQLQLEAAALTSKHEQRQHFNDNDPLPWIWIDGLRYDYHSEEEDTDPTVRRNNSTNRLLQIVCAAHQSRTNHPHPACPSTATNVAAATSTFDDSGDDVPRLQGVLSYN